MPFVIIAKEKLGTAGEKIETTEFSGTTLRIGRGTNNDLHLVDHSVQIHHAIILEEGERYILRDLNVLSLTSVNDAPVKEIALLETGTIRIGPYTLRFARPTPTSPLTIEYEVLADVVRDATLTTAALGVRPPSPPSKMRDEKFHLVAAYQLQSLYINKITIAILAVLVVLGGSALVFALGKRWVFMPGSISMKHRLFASDCVRCHVAWNPVLAGVPDKTCLSCHSGNAPHFSERAFSPAPQCASCHVEHRGQAGLAALVDSACVQCHGDLMVKEPRIPITTKLHSFTADHPEFAISVLRLEHTVQRAGLDEGKQVVDTAAINLNHHLHLKPDLMGPDGPEQLVCASCHTPDERGAYMRPIKYERDCMRCHRLDFDERLPEKTVPHGQTLEKVDQFLRATYAEYYLLQHQSALKAQAPARQLPGAPKPKEEIWVNGMVEEAERLLMGPPGSETRKGKCVLCHMLDRPNGASQSASRMLFPMIVKTAMPERWLPYSVFDHKAHTILKCVACHEAAPHSEQTTDVLLPGIASCRKCHFEPGGARVQCLTCHVYHDKTQAQKPGDQAYTIEQFKKGQVTPP
jgi:FHA domain-containing protein